MKRPRLACLNDSGELVPSVVDILAPRQISVRTRATKQDSSDPSDLVLDGSYELVIFCDITRSRRI